MSVIRRPSELVGLQGLILAVIHLALEDALGTNGPKQVGRALAYFEGETYRLHLRFLGLPEWWLPEALEGVLSQI